MGNKHRRRKHRIDAKKITLYIKIATITGSVILAVLLGIYIPQRMNINESSIEMTKEYAPGEEIESSLKRNEEIIGLIDEEVSKDIQKNSDYKKEISDVKVSEEITSDGISVDQSIEETNIDIVEQEQMTSEIVVEDKEAISEVIQSAEDEKVVDKTTPEANENIDNEIVVEKTTPEKNEEQYVKDKWVDDMIQDNKDSITDIDLVEGTAIYNMLDTAYIFGLVEGGLTVEEESELMKYLESNLSPEQLGLAQNLFSKYIGLVN